MPWMASRRFTHPALESMLSEAGDASVDVWVVMAEDVVDN